ncbi:DUF983 domain-containing protein [Paracoccus kondratievae]|uniref:Zinc-finger protein n=1 Tax=Paracoccus kondratievae TaxID=135740 RepID=A0AAD3NXG1_9RHOB|nr:MULTISPECIES: DUF983 domain-containing protein [Paracoccus]QFQ87763.1 DUF983 domain-containing protein [Paracoccus kondratievae]GLK63155.1 zinc-finger protein [Paracoccus kondratievae]
MTEERSGRTAAIRGLTGRCPHCGKGRLFKGYLTIVQSCESCGEPLGLYRAADGPAFFTMTIMLLLLIPMIGFGWVLFRPDPITLLVTVGLAITVLTLLILRLVKGAFVGYLWAQREQDRGA